MALLEIEGEAYHYEFSLLLYRVEGSRWVVADPEGTLTLDDLNAMEVIPLMAGGDYPIPGRPFLIRRNVEDAWLSGLKARARALAELHGAPVIAAPVPGQGSADTQSRWRHADTAHPRFGLEVAPELMWGGDAMIVREFAGLIRDGTAYTFIENVRETDVGSWIADKREGAGRDARLTPLHAVSYNKRPLFRTAYEGFSAEAQPDADIFQGPGSLDELMQGITGSGLEPQDYIEKLITSSGVNPKGGTAIELRVLFFGLNLLGVHDRLNLPKLSGAEHLGRRAVQILKAIRKNPKNPDFEGLDLFLRHMEGGTATTRTPKFDKFLSETQKTEAAVSKQIRLAREEEDARRKALASAKKE